MALIDNIFDTCWYFIRGDMPVREFENWVYETSELESVFSKEFYMTLISTDYSSTGPVFVLKRELEEEIGGFVKRDCYCHTLPHIAGVGMGEHDDVFKSLDEKAKYGDPLWWLWLAQCSVCEQFWMIGSEERINDVFVMKRLPLSISQQIISESLWPDDFNEFGTLLKIGKECGHSVWFIDPVSPALVYTVIDLAKAKPGIEVREISELLQISLEQARAVVTEAAKDTFIRITL